MNREKFEEILISKLLNNKDDYYENFNLLKPELFESNAYRIMFSIIDSMYQQGKNIDIISLSDEMKKETGVDCSYDVASIYTLSTWNYDIKNTINELVDLNKSNKLEKVVEDLQEMIKRKEITIEDAIERAISELSKVNDTTVEDVPDIKNQLKDFI